jgi:predicted lipoprotein with Yx(FWY)xxD motif
MIATIARPDGSRQVTYNGMPLYRYAADGGAGAAKGHGVRDAFGTWHLVSANGTPVGSGGAHAGH